MDTSGYFTRINGAYYLYVTVDTTAKTFTVYSDFDYKVDSKKVATVTRLGTPAPPYASLPYQQIYIPNEEDPATKGNTILVQLPPVEAITPFFFIVDNVYAFALPTLVTVGLQFSSPIGNSDAPYPYIITNNGILAVLLMHEWLSFVWDKNNKLNPYEYWYDAKKTTKDASTPIPYKGTLVIAKPKLRQEVMNAVYAPGGRNQQWNAAMPAQFVNLHGTTNDPKPTGQSQLSWLDIYNLNSPNDNYASGTGTFPDCSNFNNQCSGWLIGGHVVMGNNTQSVVTGGGPYYIIPICGRCNSQRQLYPNAFIMSVQNPNHPAYNVTVLHGFMQ